MSLSYGSRSLGNIPLTIVNEGKVSLYPTDIEYIQYLLSRLPRELLANILTMFGTVPIYVTYLGGLRLLYPFIYLGQGQPMINLVTGELEAPVNESEIDVEEYAPLYDRAIITQVLQNYLNSVIARLGFTPSINSTLAVVSQVGLNEPIIVRVPCGEAGEFPIYRTVMMYVPWPSKYLTEKELNNIVKIELPNTENMLKLVEEEPNIVLSRVILPKILQALREKYLQQLESFARLGQYMWNRAIGDMKSGTLGYNEVNLSYRTPENRQVNIWIRGIEKPSLDLRIEEFRNELPSNLLLTVQAFNYAPSSELDKIISMLLALAYGKYLEETYNIANLYDIVRTILRTVPPTKTTIEVTGPSYLFGTSYGLEAPSRPQRLNTFLTLTYSNIDELNTLARQIDQALSKESSPTYNLILIRTSREELEKLPKLAEEIISQIMSDLAKKRESTNLILVNTGKNQVRKIELSPSMGLRELEKVLTILNM